MGVSLLSSKKSAETDGEFGARMEIEGGGSSGIPGERGPRDLFGGGAGGTEVPAVPPGLPSAAGERTGMDKGMSTLVEAMDKMNVNMTTQFQTLQQYFSDIPAGSGMHRYPKEPCESIASSC